MAKRGRPRKETPAPFDTNTTMSGTCGSCSKTKPIGKMVMYGEQAKNGVVWHKTILWCGNLACYHALTERMRDRKRDIKEALRARLKQNNAVIEE